MAKTHESEYLIHKYWSRKPANILREYLKFHFNEGDMVVDPFCGSGVFLAEAKSLNINNIGFDINPIAYILSEVTTNPPDEDELDHEINNLLIQSDKFRDQFSHNGKAFRYCVHEMESRCQNCSIICSPSSSVAEKGKYKCSNCGEKLSFNFEKISGTRIIKFYDRDNIEYSDKKSLLCQEKLCKVDIVSEFERALITNRRILAFPEMKLSDLFTPRVFNFYSELFSHIHKIGNIKTKTALLLLLTSSIAQSSRLIPYRNNLKTGGPAWTVPGFWMAPVHLETNPIIHLEARIKKFKKGIISLRNKYKHSNVESKIINTPAQKGLLSLKDGTIDGIFFDPPYGDSIPYVEFSAIWNSFLKIKENYEDEIIVSDRKKYLSTWETYGSHFQNIVPLFYKKLSSNGKLIMTFNNLDPKAWKIVIGTLRNNDFICTEAKYQIPAVISSKSQMASKTSYVGDFYCVFKKRSTKNTLDDNFYHLTEIARKIIKSRGGKAPINLVHRMILLNILNKHMNLEFIDKYEEAILPIAEKSKDFYTLRNNLGNNEVTETLDKILYKTANLYLRKGRLKLQDFYEKILIETSEIGAPTLGEVKEVLKGVVFFDKDFCYLQ